MKTLINISDFGLLKLLFATMFYGAQRVNLFIPGWFILILKKDVHNILFYFGLFQFVIMCVGLHLYIASDFENIMT